MISIDQNKCIGCGLCMKDCFFGVLEMKDGSEREITGYY